MKQGKRLIAILLIGSLVLSAFGGTRTAEAKKKLKFNKTKITMKVGKEKLLKIKNNTEVKSVKWHSSNKKVVNFITKSEQDCWLRARKTGIAKITAKIGKVKLTCKVTVKKTSDSSSGNKKEVVKKYGSVSGNVTYYYNKYRGDVADTRAYVALLPLSGSAKNIPSVPWGDPSYVKQYNADGVYMTQVDGTGHYTVNSVLEGDYIIVIVSRHTIAEEGWHDRETYISRFANLISPYLSVENVKILCDVFFSISGYKYITDTVSVRENENYVYGYDFGITYI
ncbi:MAG: hypothetical protein NC293_02865 [Roseburia sp.]|nr:hypothetical protein [Roseburia sp.]